MCYFIFTALFIFVLHIQLSKESVYNCSQFHDVYHEPLVQCPPSKFMLKNNLVECFDNYSKTRNQDYFEYWCTSRKDMDEEMIKQVIVTPAYVDNELNDVIFKPFSTRYRFNGTHFKCDSEEEWASSWFGIDTHNIPFSPCTTNTTIPANILYQSRTNTL